MLIAGFPRRPVMPLLTKFSLPFALSVAPWAFSRGSPSPWLTIYLVKMEKKTQTHLVVKWMN